MRYTKANIKEYINANELDAHVAIGDCKSIIELLKEEDDVSFENVDVISAVLEMQEQLIFEEVAVA